MAKKTTVAKKDKQPHGLQPDTPPTKPVAQATATPDLDAEIAAKEQKLKDLNDQLSGKKQYCPPDILAIVHEVLGTEFTAVVKARTDSPHFDLDILVPEAYSSFTKEQKEMLHDDHRVIVIANADGLNGVRKYCEGVRDEIKRSLSTAPLPPPVVQPATH